MKKRIKMKQIGYRNKKLFWIQISNVNGGKEESSTRIEDWIGRLPVAKYMLKASKDYFEDLYIVETEDLDKGNKINTLRMVK